MPEPIPTPAPSAPVSAPAPSAAPQGTGVAGLGTQSGGSPPAAPTQTPAAPITAQPSTATTFANMLRDKLDAAAAPTAGPGQPAPAAQPQPQPAAGATPPAPAPAAPAPSPEILALQSQIAQLQSQIIPPDELLAMRQMAQYGWQMRQQQMQQAPAAPQPQGQPQATPTGVVPFSEADRAWLTTDANGQVAAIPGAPADIVQRYHQHQSSLTRYLRDFATDPAKALGPIMEELARKTAAQQYQQATQQQQFQQEANQITSENANWIYQQNPQGQIQYDWQNRPVLTPNGQRYAGFIEQAREMGIQSPRHMHQYAYGQMMAAIVSQPAVMQRLQSVLTQQPAAPAAPPPAAPAPVAPPQFQQQLQTLPPAPGSREAFLLMAQQQAQQNGQFGFTPGVNGFNPNAAPPTMPGQNQIGPTLGNRTNPLQMLRETAARLGQPLAG